MDFKSYRKNKMSAQEPTTPIKEPKTLTKEQKEMQQNIDKYSGMSQSQLQEQLQTMYETQKSQGTISKSELFDMIENLTPYVTSEQKQNMKNMVEHLN